MTGPVPRGRRRSVLRAVLWRAALPALAAGLLAMHAGAAEPPPVPLARPLPDKLPDDPFAGMAERFQRLAKRDEAAKEWHRALMRWEAVAAIDPRDRQARGRISAIRRLLRKEADRHFALAKAAHQKGLYGKAFREFLRTLSYDPDRHLALAMVKHDLNARSVNPYTVKAGDTTAKIAEATYGEADLAYLVRYFNDVRSDRNLKPGQTLELPVMAGVQVAVTEPRRRPEPRARKPAPSASKKREAVARRKAPAPKAPPAAVAKREAPAARAAKPAPVSAALAIVAKEVRQAEVPNDRYSEAQSDRQMAAAQRHFKAGRFDEAANAAEAVLDEDPTNRAAREMIDASYYEQGVRLRKRNQPVAAMQMFSRVNDNYKDVRAQRAALSRNLSGNAAEVHYIAGVTAFLDENLDKAIQEWEQTLKLDPNHPQAAKDLRNARALRAKLAQVN